MHSSVIFYETDEEDEEMVFRTEEEALKAVKRRGRALADAPEDFRWPELCQEAVKAAGSALEFVPDIWKDEEMCLTAVTRNGYALMFVPERFKSILICRTALENDPDAIRYIPGAKRDEDMCVHAVTLRGSALEFVPFHLRTIAVCRAALTNDENAMTHVPDDKKRIRAAMEGHLLTLHLQASSWQVEVTDMGGGSLVTETTHYQEIWSVLLARLRAALDEVDYTFPKIFVSPNGQFLHELPDDGLVGEVFSTHADPSAGCTSAFYL